MKNYTQRNWAYFESLGEKDLINGGGFWWPKILKLVFKSQHGKEGKSDMELLWSSDFVEVCTRGRWRQVCWRGLAPAPRAPQGLRRVPPELCPAWRWERASGELVPRGRRSGARRRPRNPPLSLGLLETRLVSSCVHHVC